MPAEDPANSLVMKYNPSDARIAEVRSKYEEVLAALPVLVAAEDAEPITSALKEIVPLRTELEKTRVALKAESLAFGRRVDGEAQRLRGLILAFEKPLQDAKAEIEAKEKARAEEKVRAEEAAAAEAKRIIDEAAAKVKREQDEAREAAQKKLDDERAAFERDKAEAAEKEAAAQRLRDAQKAELDAQAKKIADDLEKLAREKREEAERVERRKREIEEKQQRDKEAAELKERLEREAKEKAERDAAEAARQKKVREEAEAAEAKAAKDAQPDIVKIQEFGHDLSALIISQFPNVPAGCRATQFLSEAKRALVATADDFINYKFPKRGSR